MKIKILFLAGVFISQIVFSQQTEKKFWQTNTFKTLAVPTVLVGYGLICQNANGLPSSDEVKRWRDKNYYSFNTNIDDFTAFVPAQLYPCIPLVGIIARQPWLRIGMQDGHEDRRVDEPGFPSETRRHLGPWLRTLAGLCLAAAMAGGAVIAAGGSTAGADAHIVAPSPSAPCPCRPSSPCPVLPERSAG